MKTVRSSYLCVMPKNQKKKKEKINNEMCIRFFLLIIGIAISWFKAIPKN